MKTLAILSLALAFSMSNTAKADSLCARCGGDSIHFSFASYGILADAAGQTLNIRGRVIGSCDPAFKVNPTPFEYPPLGERREYSVTLPAPNQGRYLAYTLYREDAAGNAYSVPGSGDPLPFAYEACTAEAVFARGILWNLTGELFLVSCEGKCWIDHPLVMAEAGWEAFVNSGQLVNVYGEAYVDGMPGGSFLLVSKVVAEEADDGCEALVGGV